MQKYVPPKYITVLDNRTDTYQVEGMDSGEVIIDKLPSMQAATAIAQLCCLGHICMTTSGDLLITAEVLPEGTEIELEDEEEELTDDGPVYAHVDDNEDVEWDPSIQRTMPKEAV